MGYAKIYKRWIKKEVQNKQKKGKRKDEKRQPMFSQKYSIREKYISKSIVELGEPLDIPHTCTS